MPGSNAGTGQPITFLCPVYRKSRRGYFGASRDAHQVVRTGRTKKRHFRAMGIRMLPELHEYCCSCGHVGWSAHKDLLCYALLSPDAPTEEATSPGRVQAPHAEEPTTRKR